MSTDTTFRILIILIMGVNFAISGYFRYQADKQGGRLEPSGNRVLIILRLGALAVVLPLIAYLINPSWTTWAHYQSPVWLRWLGFALTASMIPLIYWLFSTIGNNISPSHTTRTNHQLITNGPYRYIRHPLYTFGFLAWFGVGLMAAMWWLLAGLLIMCSLLAWRTPKEEANLIAQFGPDYEAYMQKTGRYWPRVG